MERYALKKKSEALRQAGAWLLDLLFPPRCVICDEVLRAEERADGCCALCAPGLPWTGGTVCMKCGRPLLQPEREYCGDCAEGRHRFDRGAAAFVYTGGIRQSVQRMKFQNRRDYVPFYAKAMLRASARLLERHRPELILPVPMHPARRRRRGYNQAELLARNLSSLTGIPVRADLLYNTRRTLPQKQLDRRERLRNLRGSIALREPFPPVRRVLLADDVYTTGSTMDEIAGLLKRRGVEEVYFAVLCIGKGKKAVCTAENLCYTKRNTTRANARVTAGGGSVYDCCQPRSDKGEERSG